MALRFNLVFHLNKLLICGLECGLECVKQGSNGMTFYRERKFLTG